VILAEPTRVRLLLDRVSLIQHHHNTDLCLLLIRKEVQSTQIFLVLLLEHTTSSQQQSSVELYLLRLFENNQSSRTKPLLPEWVPWQHLDADPYLLFVFTINQLSLIFLAHPLERALFNKENYADLCLLLYENGQSSLVPFLSRGVHTIYQQHTLELHSRIFFKNNQSSLEFLPHHLKQISFK
jgi:hypothetical protein